MKVLDSISHWAIFGLMLSLVPLLVKVWKLNGVGNLDGIDLLMEATKNGELLIICASLLGVNIGELIKLTTPIETLRKILVGFSLLMCLFNTMAYYELVSSKLDPNYIFQTSSYSFTATVILCLISLVLMVVGDNKEEVE